MDWWLLSHLEGEVSLPDEVHPGPEVDVGRHGGLGGAQGGLPGTVEVQGEPAPGEGKLAAGKQEHVVYGLSNGHVRKIFLWATHISSLSDLQERVLTK